MIVLRMKKVTRIFAAITLIVAMACAACTKDPENGGNNNSSGGGNGGYSTYNGHEYVDLGLPSGTLWATCNVGATSSEDYGYYFAWGETEPKNDYSWSTYRYCNGSFVTFTKYCNNPTYGENGFTDDLTTLQPEDDAAIVKWGGDWRMPTQTEWEELINHTTNIWTTQNGVHGQLFTATNGVSLFLPAAGIGRGNGYMVVGSSGYYWSSTLFSDSTDFGRCFFFYSAGCGTPDYCYRCYGLSVRPVCSAHQN